MCLFIHEVTTRAPTRLKTRGSLLGLLYNDNITTLAILPMRIRHDQPNESSQRPCGREAGLRPPAAFLAHPLLPREVHEHDTHGGGKKGSMCEEKCESESNPKPRPKLKPSSADVAEKCVASIGVRSSGNLCVGEEYV
jgi:hypothetical protein